jgi:protein tyrosine phosphatase
VVVHCSAGVGRTGTFIALFRLSAMVESGLCAETVDVFNEVFQLRADRCKMVSIHMCFLCYVQFPKTHFAEFQFDKKIICQKINLPIFWY